MSQITRGRTFQMVYLPTRDPGGLAARSWNGNVGCSSELSQRSRVTYVYMRNVGQRENVNGRRPVTRKKNTFFFFETLFVIQSREGARVM